MQTEPIKDKKLYIVVSQTDSIVSALLKLITGAKYNHAAISLDPSLTEMYSFARKYNYCPFWGAFVKESPDKGALKRFKNTEICLVEVPVSDEQYGAVKNYLMQMYEEREKYRYNYRGLFLAYFKKPYRREYHYYCSEFVREVLERFAIVDKTFFGEIVKPIDFLSLPGGQITYQGKLKQYRQEVCRISSGVAAGQKEGALLP